MARMRNKDYGLGKSVLMLFYCAIFCAFGAGSVWAADRPPAGTYTKTCKNINYSAGQDRILASCKRLNGNWKNTQFSNCSQCLAQHGDIENCDGTIECTGVNIPNVGSYKRSCFCCRMEGSTLRCYCITRNNVSRLTSLPNAGNYRDIWNDNGALKGR